jgi:hypothetical protein
LIVTSPGWGHSGLPISLCSMYPLLSKWSSLLVNHLKFIHKVNDHKMHAKCNFTLSLFWKYVPFVAFFYSSHKRKGHVSYIFFTSITGIRSSATLSYFNPPNKH